METLLSSEVVSKLSSRELPPGNGKPGTTPAPGTGNYWDDLEIDMITANDMSGETNQAFSGLSMLPSIADQYFSNELIGFGLQENLPSREIIDELSASTYLQARYMLTLAGTISISPGSIHLHQLYRSIDT